MPFLKTFPQPLAAEEEQYYLQRLKEGDAQARDVLVERNLRLVAHIVKKYQNSGEETEDLISIGTIGLIKAIMIPSARTKREMKFICWTSWRAASGTRFPGSV